MLGAIWMVLLAGVLAVPGALAADGAGKKKTGQSAVDIILRLTRAGYPASWENVRRVIDGDLVLPSERKTSSSTSGGKTAGSGADTRSRKPAQKAKPSNTKRNATNSRPASEPRRKFGRTRERRNRDSGWKSYYVVIWGARDSIRPGSLYPERNQTPVAKRRRVDQYLLFEQTRVRRPGKSRWHACHNVKAGLTVDEYRVKRSGFQQHRQRLRRGRRVQARGQYVPVARGYAQVFHAVQWLARYLEHARAGFVGGFCLFGRLCVQGWVSGARNAVQHTPHGGCKQCAGLVRVDHGFDCGCLLGDRRRGLCHGHMHGRPV